MHHCLRHDSESVIEAFPENELYSTRRIAMIDLDEEESVFVTQLIQVRRQKVQSEIEDRTQSERLLTILRGRGSSTARSKDGSIITRHQIFDQEAVIITSPNII